MALQPLMHVVGVPISSCFSAPVLPILGDNDILSVPSDNSSAFHDIAFDVVLPSIKSRLCLLLRARVFTDLSSQCLGGAGLDPAVPHLPVHLVGRWNIGYHSDLQLSIFRYPVTLL